MQSILITDCLQYDFVGRLGRFESLPNPLHVGYQESLRLLGEDPAQGPVARVIAWAHRQPDEALKVVHVRDWHEPDDPAQRAHLEQFGAHCLRDSQGARFVFDTEEARAGKRIEVVSTTTLSDFVGAGLGGILARYADQPIRVGLMGVWTEAKITFLAYDIRTRHPQFELAVCSALTASSSRHNHFLALEQLERILGVRVLASVGEFVRFLGGEMEDAPLIGFSGKHPTVESDARAALTETDEKLIRYLFRSCRHVSLRSLDGGFSGNLVLAAHSANLFGEQEAPHVVKIGPGRLIGREREAFERIETVLGNNAPRIADFADISGRGAIKYRYASMGRGAARSLQSLYQSADRDAQVAAALDSVFLEQLGRLYRAAEPRRCDLLEYYQFSQRWARPLRERVVALMGDEGHSDTLVFPGGRRVRNITALYESDLPQLPRPVRERYFSYLHGDLNGANIIVDGPGNVWLIDFFHAHRGHVLKDLIKLENDLLYVWTEIRSERELGAALEITEALMAVEDLGAPLVRRLTALREPGLARAWNLVHRLRSYYAEFVKKDRDVSQLLIGQIRYAVHTLGFEEASSLQKRWALYAACRAAETLKAQLGQAGRLRVDWLPSEFTPRGRLGLTWLPGRRDAGRVLGDDVRALIDQGGRAVVCLLSPEEFARYGVEDLLEAYRASGLEVLHSPILDGGCPSMQQMNAVITWIAERAAAERSVVVHCVGGLGRAGTVAACWLRTRGVAASRAMEIVRQTRSRRAIETAVQERFISRFDPLCRVLPGSPG